METTGVQVTLVWLFTAGGIFMWPLLFLSIMGLAICIERGFAIVLFHRKTARLLHFLVSGGKMESPFEGIGAHLFSLPPERADRALGDVVQLAFDRMGRSLELLAAIGNLAPLVGFIGTISGMISAFQSIAQADRVSVRLVANGIAEALITTGAGLIIAVVVVFTEHLIRYYLVSRAHRIEETATVLFSEVRNREENTSPVDAAGGPTS